MFIVPIAAFTFYLIIHHCAMVSRYYALEKKLLERGLNFAMLRRKPWQAKGWRGSFVWMDRKARYMAMEPDKRPSLFTPRERLYLGMTKPKVTRDSFMLSERAHWKYVRVPSDMDRLTGHLFYDWVLRRTRSSLERSGADNCQP